MKYDRLYNFISPVTGKLPIDSGYILLGDKDGHSFSSPVLIDIRQDLIDLKRGLGYFNNLKKLETDKIWIGNYSNKPEARTQIGLINLPLLDVAKFPDPTGTIGNFSIPNPSFNPTTTMDWVMSGPFLGQSFVASSDITGTNWNTAISSTLAMSQIRAMQSLKRLDQGTFVVKNKTLNYNWTNPAMASIPAEVKSLYDLQDSYTFQNAQALDSLPQGSGFILMVDASGNLYKNNVNIDETGEVYATSLHTKTNPSDIVSVFEADKFGNVTAKGNVITDSIISLSKRNNQPVFSLQAYISQGVNRSYLNVDDINVQDFSTPNTFAVLNGMINARSLFLWQFFGESNSQLLFVQNGSVSAGDQIALSQLPNLQRDWIFVGNANNRPVAVDPRTLDWTNSSMDAFTSIFNTTISTLFPAVLSTIWNIITFQWDEILIPSPVYTADQVTKGIKSVSDMVKDGKIPASEDYVDTSIDEKEIEITGDVSGIGTLNGAINTTFNKKLNEISNSGNINIGGYRINNLSDPVNINDASNKSYVDNKKLNQFQNTGDINIANHKITNLANPVDNADAVNKGYVDSKTLNQIKDGNDYVKIISDEGGVRSKVHFFSASKNADVAIFNFPRSTGVSQWDSGDFTLSMPLKMNSDIQMNNTIINGLPTPALNTSVISQAANVDFVKQYVASQGVGGSITLVGDISGTGNIGTDINTTLNKTLNQINAPTGSLNLNSQNITNLASPINDNDAGNKIYIDNKTWVVSKITDFDTSVRAYRLDQFATPTSLVNLNNQRITNLGTPTLSTDAVTMGYVDSKTWSTSAITGLSSFILATAVNTVSGTANQILVTGLLTPTIALVDNPIIPGTASLTIPIGNNAQRPSVPTNGMIRANNSSTNVFLEFYYNSSWNPILLGLTAGSNISITATDVAKPTISVNISSNLNINNYAINNLANPINNNDAANKLYVDSKVSNIPISSLAGYPSNSNVFLRGDGTWNTLNSTVPTYMYVPTSAIIIDPITGTTTDTADFRIYSQSTYAVPKTSFSVFDTTSNNGISIGIDRTNPYTFIKTGLKGLNFDINGTVRLQLPAGSPYTNPIVINGNVKIDTTSTYIPFEIISTMGYGTGKVWIDPNTFYLRYKGANVRNSKQSLIIETNVYNETASIAMNGDYIQTIQTFDDLGFIFTDEDKDPQSSWQSYISSSGSLVTSSSKKKKHSIRKKEHKNYLERLNKLNIYSYALKTPILDNDNEKTKTRKYFKNKQLHLGLLSEEVEELFNNCTDNFKTIEFDKSNKKEIKESIKDYIPKVDEQEYIKVKNQKKGDIIGIKYDSLLCYTILALQELSKKVDQLQTGVMTNE